VFNALEGEFFVRLCSYSEFLGQFTVLHITDAEIAKPLFGTPNSVSSANLGAL
jgi:hypothetical protein